MYVIGINGPPHSGKDTFAAALLHHLIQTATPAYPLIHHLATPLRQVALELCCHPPLNLSWTEDAARYSAFKSTIQPPFPITGRQLMIDLSESFLKPLYGKDIMARLWVHSLPTFEQTPIILVPDFGFAHEANHIRDHVGEDNLFLVRMHRPGCDFAGDSRSFLTLRKSRNTFDCPNGGHKSDLDKEAVRLAARLRNLGWKI